MHKSTIIQTAIRLIDGPSCGMELEISGELSELLWIPDPPQVVRWGGMITTSPMLITCYRRTDEKAVDGRQIYRFEGREG